MDKSQVLSEANDFAKDLSDLPEDERRIVKGIIVGLKLKAEIDDHKKGA